MNKLDALIDDCKAAEDEGPMAFTLPDVIAIRRILEAVREDSRDAIAECNALRVAGLCAHYREDRKACHGCPAEHYAATRAALEQLK